MEVLRKRKRLPAKASHRETGKAAKSGGGTEREDRKREAVLSKKFNESETLFEIHLKELGIEFLREVKFDSKREWRLDFVLPWGIAVEIEGGIWTQGRHTRGKGYQEDLEKYNAATMSGLRVLRFSSEDVLTGRAKQFLEKHLPEINEAAATHLERAGSEGRVNGRD